MQDPKPHTPSYRHLVSQFTQAMADKGYLHRKPHHFTQSIREFLWWLEHNSIYQVEDVKTHHIHAYHHYLQERPHQRRSGTLTSSTVNWHLYVLRLLFDHLMDCGLQASPMHLPSFILSPSAQKKVPTVAEIQQLYQVAQTARDRAILSLAYGAGLRRTELQNLNQNDLFLHRGLLHVINGKGQKTASVVLSNPVIEHLRDYLIHERPRYASTQHPTNAFLLNRFGQRLDGQTSNSRLKHLAHNTQNQALIDKKPTLHSLRHAIATHLIEAGMDLWDVSRFMRHSDIDTTHHYSKQRRRQSQVKRQMQTA